MRQEDRSEMCHERFLAYVLRRDTPERHSPKVHTKALIEAASSEHLLLTLWKSTQASPMVGPHGTRP